MEPASHARRWICAPGLGIFLTVACLALLPGPGPALGQEKKAAEPKAVPRSDAAADAPAADPVAAPREGDATAPEPLGPEPIAPAAPALSPEEARKAMLEKLADNLSKRMRALAERERIAAEREKVLSDREEALKERESLLDARENVVRRREKLPPPQSWNGPDAPTIVGKYATVIDGRTMQIYHEKAALEKTPVASTQKLLTALIVCSESDLDQEIVVPEEVLRVEPTVVGLKPGQTYTRRELIRALLVKSGNDVAATLAIDSAGSIEAFADKMNSFARSLGMENSHFINPHGLPAEGQYSCAHDMALVAFEAYQIPDIREITKLKSTTFVFDDGTTRELSNTNSVLKTNEHCNGMKTGFTYAAGHCLVASGEKDGQDRIVVVIKSHKPYVWTDSSKLLDWALDLETRPGSAAPVAAMP
jgi:D-alanyl-D-alanine carboxypeptidase (penicillin-binding protein 5/6)